VEDELEGERREGEGRETDCSRKGGVREEAKQKKVTRRRKQIVMKEEA
jgi:hypothetical protein